MEDSVLNDSGELVQRRAIYEERVQSLSTEDVRAALIAKELELEAMARELAT